MFQFREACFESINRTLELANLLLAHFEYKALITILNYMFILAKS